MNLSLIPEYATATSGDTNIFKGNEDQSQQASKAIIKEASGQNF